jgi:hypothetical protein
VLVGKHTLTAQAEQLESITARIGRRLNHWLRTHPDVLPGAEFFEAFRYCQAALLGLLREQRERVEVELKRTSDAAMRKLDDQHLEATIWDGLLEYARSMTPEQWARLDKVRAEQSNKGQGG